VVRRRRHHNCVDDGRSSNCRARALGPFGFGRCRSRRYVAEANEFGDVVAQLLDATGKGTRLHRLLLV
jgi:hypothetical protein